MDNLERDNNVIYELYSDYLGKAYIQPPKGWSSDTESYSRDTDSRAILSKIDVKLEFYGNGADYLKNVYYNRGVQEIVQLTKYEKDKYSLDEAWKVKYIQQLDMTTFKEVTKTNNVTVSSTEGGLFSVIDNKKSEDFDLLDNYSYDDTYIGELTTHKFQPLGRKIFLESKLEDSQTGYRINSRRYDNLGGNYVETSRPIPLKITYNSNVDDITVPLNSEDTNNEATHNNNYGTGDTVDIGDFFFYRAERDLDLIINLDLKYKLTKIKEGSNITPEYIGVKLYKTTLVGSSDNVSEVRTIYVSEGDPYNIIDDVIVVTLTNEPISLLEGQSLCISFFTISYYKGLFGNGYADFYVNVLNSKVVVEDVTDYTTIVTVSKCIKPIDLFDRLVAKITGETGLVKSSIFESGGEYEYMVVDNGLWARGFPNTYTDSSDEEQNIQITTSFEDAFESYNYLEPLAWFTEKIGNKEYVRIEKAKHTQQNFIGISLGVVDDVEYDSSAEDYFSTIEIGQEDDLEYEEINGLDETNGLSNFSTFINQNISEYSVISKYNIDSVGYELTRRFNYENYPKEDTSRDENIWLHDAKLLDGVITHRRWYDDRFDEKPTGIYDADSTWNLWLSPMNRLYYGHAYSVKRGLYHYDDKKITFGSSNANQNLTTVKDGVTLKESGSLTIKNLENPRVEATMVELTFKNTQEIENMFKGTTNVNGVEVPNYFGLIEYIENGKRKYGRLVTLDNSEESKLTLIKARI